MKIQTVSKFLPLIIFRHNFKQDNDQINIYKRFANKQTDILYYIAENSYEKIKESTVNMFFCFLPFSIITSRETETFCKLMYWPNVRTKRRTATIISMY